LRIVEILEVKPAREQDYDGRLKPMVAAFMTANYMAEMERVARRAALMKRAEAKVAELSKISALEAIAGNDLEAREILDELKGLRD